MWTKNIYDFFMGFCVGCVIGIKIILDIKKR